MESIRVPHFNDTNITAALYKDVENAAFLRQQLLDGNSDFEYGFLDASMLLSRNHILAACFRCLNDSKQGRLKSRNIHSEVVFSLSPNNNISESFRRFGISDTTRHIVALKIGSSFERDKEHLNEVVKGVITPLTDDNLASIRDGSRIKKIYKFDAPKKGEELDLDDAFAIGSMALKGS